MDSLADSKPTKEKEPEKVVQHECCCNKSSTTCVTRYIYLPHPYSLKGKPGIRVQKIPPTKEASTLKLFLHHLFGFLRIPVKRRHESESGDPSRPKSKLARSVSMPETRTSHLAISNDLSPKFTTPKSEKNLFERCSSDKFQRYPGSKDLKDERVEPPSVKGENGESASIGDGDDEQRLEQERTPPRQTPSPKFKSKKSVMAMSGIGSGRKKDKSDRKKIVKKLNEAMVAQQYVKKLKQLAAEKVEIALEKHSVEDINALKPYYFLKDAYLQLENENNSIVATNPFKEKLDSVMRSSSFDFNPIDKEQKQNSDGVTNEPPTIQYKTEQNELNLIEENGNIPTESVKSDIHPIVDTNNYNNEIHTTEDELKQDGDTIMTNEEPAIQFDSKMKETSLADTLGETELTLVDKLGETINCEKQSFLFSSIEDESVVYFDEADIVVNAEVTVDSVANPRDDEVDRNVTISNVSSAEIDQATMEIPKNAVDVEQMQVSKMVDDVGEEQTVPKTPGAADAAPL